MGTVFLTGATGFVGRGVLGRMLASDPELRVVALVRDRSRWKTTSGRLGNVRRRVTAVVGDLTRPGLGLDRDTRDRLAAHASAAMHLAADTSFSLSPMDADRVNVHGTRHALELTSGWPNARRFVLVSTAFAVGRRTGCIREGMSAGGSGWVNEYERSKHEAEDLVREWGREWVIFRPSTLAYRSVTGAVGQLNAVHRALRLFRRGLVPMVPGRDDTPVDTVCSDYVCDAIARLALRPGLAGRTLHLCSGPGALTLSEVFQRTYDLWRTEPGWRARGILPPVITSLDTYRLFEDSVEQTGDARLKRMVGALSHFVPQLAYPKNFETAATASLLGHDAPPMREWWDRMLRQLVRVHWRRPRAVASSAAP